MEKDSQQHVHLNTFNQGDVVQIASHYNPSSYDVLHILQNGPQPLVHIIQLDGQNVSGEPIVLLGSISKELFHDKLSNSQRKSDYAPGVLTHRKRYVMQCGAHILLSDISIGEIERVGRKKVSRSTKNRALKPVLPNWTVNLDNNK